LAAMSRAASLCDVECMRDEADKIIAVRYDREIAPFAAVEES
jgi:hypothetical protein